MNELEIVKQELEKHHGKGNEISAGVIEEWVAGGMKESEEELAEITKACLFGTVNSLKDAF